MGFFTKSKKTEPERSVQGLSVSEYNMICDELSELYLEGKARQKSYDAKPSAFMLGIKAAMDVLAKYEPHEL